MKDKRAWTSLRYKEVKEEMPFCFRDCEGNLIPQDRFPVDRTDWQIEFKAHQYSGCRNAYFYDPRHNHAEEVLDNIRRIHPDIDRIFA